MSSYLFFCIFASRKTKTQLTNGKLEAQIEIQWLLL